MSHPNCEGCEPASSAPPKTHTNPHSDFANVCELEQGCKRFNTLRASLALKGYSLHELSCDGYLIARWNLTRHAPDLRAVGAFLRQIGGAA
jgi:hypothetical protein